MAIPMSSADELRLHWFAGSSLAMREALENLSTKADYDWAVGFAAGYE
jgi:hypothetical protein